MCCISTIFLLTCLKPKVWLDWKLSWGGSGSGSKWPCAPFPSKHSSASVLSKLSDLTANMWQQVQYRYNQASPNTEPIPVAMFKRMHVVSSPFYGKKSDTASLLFFCLRLVLHLKRRWPLCRNGKGHWTLWWPKSFWCAGVLGVISLCGQGIDNMMELIRGKFFWEVKAACTCTCTHTWHLSSLARSLVMISSNQSFCCPPLTTRHVQRAAATSAFSLSTQSHCTGPLRGAALRPHL